MNQKNLFKHTILAMAVSFVSTNTSAAGFQLNEYSTSALGRAFFQVKGRLAIMLALVAAIQQP